MDQRYYRPPRRNLPSQEELIATTFGLVASPEMCQSSLPVETLKDSQPSSDANGNSEFDDVLRLGEWRPLIPWDSPDAHLGAVERDYDTGDPWQQD